MAAEVAGRFSQGPSVSPPAPPLVGGGVGDRSMGSGGRVLGGSPVEIPPCWCWRPAPVETGNDLGPLCGRGYLCASRKGFVFPASYAGFYGPVASLAGSLSAA